VATGSVVVVVGGAIGAVSFALAMLMIPEVRTPSQHDLMLGKNLAFVFPLLIGSWAGFVRRSLGMWYAPS
jgi:hypothetical protein